MPHDITLRYSDDLPASPRWRMIERIAIADRRSTGHRFGEPCDPVSLTALYDVDCILDTYERYEEHYGRSMQGVFRGLARWSGVLFADESGSYIIMLNPDHGLYRRRLTLAHEFGHMAFGHQPLRVDMVGGLPSTRYSDQQELEAYGYALAVLLPYAPIMQMLQQGATLRGIANHYSVSLQALSMRLKTVGLWGFTTSRG